MTNEQQNIIKAIQEVNNKQTEEIKNHINIELKEIKEEIRRESQRLTNLEQKCTQIQQKYQALEKSLRRNNIIIFGLEHKSGNLLEHTINKLNFHLELSLVPNDINNLYKIGKEKENRPIIVKLTTFWKKQNILKNCNKLKNTNIRISEELSIEEREEVRTLQKYLKKARSKNLKAYIRGTKLYVNGKQYKASELTDTEEFSESETSTDGEKNKNGDVRTQKEKTKKPTGTPFTPATSSQTTATTAKESNNTNNISKELTRKPNTRQTTLQEIRNTK